MDLRGKKVIAIGERDGVPSPALAACAKSAGASVIYQLTQCFVWTAAGAMDLEDQAGIKRVVEEHQNEELVVLLGSPDAESAEVYARTVTTGDPSYAGPLAGVQLGLPVYHIFEPEIKEIIDKEIYDDQAALMELALDAEAICAAVRKIREEMRQVSWSWKHG